MPKLAITRLKEIQIPLPPLQKQKEIVSYLDQIFAKNKELKTKYESQLKELEELKQSLLKDAFEGKLAI
jgi:type I restriction enzyme S subunit